MYRYLVCAVLAAWIDTASAQYAVAVGSADDLTFSLQIPPSTNPVTLRSRASDLGLESQVHDVRCGSTVLSPDDTGEWRLPADCSVATWRVKPDWVTQDGISVDAQRTFAYRTSGGQWYVISEPTSILRTPAHEGRLSIHEAGGDGDTFAATVELQRGQFILPNLGEAPEFYVLGRAPRRTEAVDVLKITYILDDPEKIQELGLVDFHAKSVAYLAKVVNLPAETSPSRNNVTVVWVGTRRQNGALSGAAGGRSFLANYISDEEASDSQSVAWAVAIAAHEQFHQLTNMLDARLPVWLAESLAHYYGLKSLLENENLLSAVEVRRRFIDIGRSVESGLLELNRRYTSGEGSVYGLFYSQGATFWHLLDMAISRATDSKRTLDSLIPELLRAQQPADGNLPASFIETLRETVGTAADDILSRYLGPAQ